MTCVTIVRDWLLLCVVLLQVGGLAVADEYDTERAALIRTIESDVRATSSYLDKNALDERVLEAMRKVPRHQFVPEAAGAEAYQNRPLAIGHGQTISQPYIVAIMTDLLQPQKNHRVLEIGTGSGYQAAVMSLLTDTVFSMEIIEPLGNQARERLALLGYSNVQLRIGDGYFGWKEHAPFDAIIVTAAASHIPPPLVQQLKPGGRMIIPVGSAFMVQQLVLVQKTMAGEVSLKQLLPVRFVPLTGARND